MASQESTYRPEIDGLRAIAVLGVVLFHVGLSTVRGGFAGVDVFFVISGYLITSLLVAERTKQGRISLVEFYARRMRRLLPALLLVVTVTVGGAVLLLSPDLHEVQDVAKSAVASLTLVSNVLFFRETGGYFDGPAEHIPLLHIWSLSVEEQFYLFWPLFVALLLRARPRSQWLPIALLSVGTWLCALWLVWRRPEAAFYLTPFRAWEFGVGGLVAICRPRNLSDGARGNAVLLGLGAILVAFVATPRDHWFPAVGALAPVLGTGFVLIGVADGGLDSIASRFLRSRPMVALGRLSYSWYLWHWPPLALYAALSLEGGTFTGRAAIGLASLALAAVTLRWVEDPVRRRRIGRSWSARRTLFAGAAFSAIAVFLFVGAAYSANSTAARVSELRSVREEPALNSDRCSLGYRATGLPPLDSLCVMGSPDSGVALLVGDSHALAWVPFATTFAEAHHLGLVRLDTDGCPLMLAKYSDSVGTVRSPVTIRTCRHHNDRTLKILSTASFRGHRIAAVIIARRWSGSVNGPFSALDRPAYDRLGPVVHAVLRRVGESFPAIVAQIPATIEVVLMGPVPELRSSTAICLARHDEDDCAMPRVVFDSTRAFVLPILAASIRGRAGVVVDPVDYFCDSVQCPVRRHGVLLFSDDDHISRRAARNFALEWMRTAAAESVSGRLSGQR